MEGEQRGRRVWKREYGHPLQIWLGRWISALILHGDGNDFHYSGAVLTETNALDVRRLGCMSDQDNHAPAEHRH